MKSIGSITYPLCNHQFERMVRNKPDDNVIPTIVIQRLQRSGEVTVSAVSFPGNTFSNEGTKQLALYQAGRDLADQDMVPVRVSLFSEGCRAPMGPCRPKDNPQRIEIVVCVTYDSRSHKAVMSDAPIRRAIDKTITPVKLCEPYDIEFPLLGNFFVGWQDRMTERFPNMAAKAKAENN